MLNGCNFYFRFNEVQVWQKHFVKVLNLLEAGSRHFQLPTGQESRVIVLAGELLKNNGTLEFNLESGTYTESIVKKLKKLKQKDFVELMSFIFHTNISRYTNRILVPQTPGTVSNVLARGRVTFNFKNKNVPTTYKNKTANQILKQLAWTHTDLIYHLYRVNL